MDKSGFKRKIGGCGWPIGVIESSETVTCLTLRANTIGIGGRSEGQRGCDGPCRSMNRSGGFWNIK
jgi:hypothetical protein